MFSCLHSGQWKNCQELHEYIDTHPGLGWLRNEWFSRSPVSREHEQNISSEAQKTSSDFTKLFVVHILIVVGVIITLSIELSRITNSALTKSNIILGVSMLLIWCALWGCVYIFSLHHSSKKYFEAWLNENWKSQKFFGDVGDLHRLIVDLKDPHAGWYDRLDCLAANGNEILNKDVPANVIKVVDEFLFEQVKAAKKLEPMPGEAKFAFEIAKSKVKDQLELFQKFGMFQNTPINHWYQRLATKQGMEAFI